MGLYFQLCYIIIYVIKFTRWLMKDTSYITTEDKMTEHNTLTNNL